MYLLVSFSASFQISLSLVLTLASSFFHFAERGVPELMWWVRKIRDRLKHVLKPIGAMFKG
jgi:hypothetical protein